MDHLSDTQLNEYLDRTLPADIHSRLDAHLGVCDDCRERLGELQLLFERLADLPEVRLSHDLTPVILSNLPRKRSRLWTPVLAGQLMAALGILLWLSFNAISPFGLPTVTGFHIPRFPITEVVPPFPAVNILPVIINFRLIAPEFQNLTNFFTGIPPLDLPHLLNYFDQWPARTIHLSNFPLAMISIASLPLWLLINAVFLRRPTEVTK